MYHSNGPMIRSCIALSLALGGLVAAPSFAQVASARAPSAVSQPQPLIMGEVHTIQSRVMGQDRRLVVRVPAEYATAPDRRYPVVYVIDGGPEQDFPHLAGLAQSAEVNGTFSPFIWSGSRQ